MTFERFVNAPVLVRRRALSAARAQSPRLAAARRAVVLAVACSLSGMGVMQEAQAALIGTDAVAHAQLDNPAAPVLNAAAARAQVLSLLERDDAVQALTARGVDPQQAHERVAALTDQEALDLARQVGQAPAGAGVLETIGFIFVLLVITDILGFTKVFPFTRSIR